MMFLDGNIGAPPTVTVISLAKVGDAARAARAKPAAVAPDRTNLANFMSSSWFACCPVGGYGDSYGGRGIADAVTSNFLGDVFVIGLREADLEARQLAVCDHRPRGLAGGRASERLKRDRKHGLVADFPQQVLRHFDGHRPVGIDQPERMRLVAGRNEPKLHGLLLGAE